jgi:hypothetical protein
MISMYVGRGAHKFCICVQSDPRITARVFHHDGRALLAWLKRAGVGPSELQIRSETRGHGQLAVDRARLPQ